MIKLLFNLFPDLRNKIFLLVFLSAISSFLDVLSLGLIGPFVGLIIDQDFFLKFPALYNFLNKINFLQINLFFFISILIILSFLIKSVISYQIIKFIQTFCFDQQLKLRNKILSYYLSMPFIIFIKKNFINKFSSITELTRIVSENALINFLRLSSDLFISMIISIYLFYIDWKISLIVISLLLLTYVAFKYFLRSKIFDLGKKTIFSLREIISGAEITLNAIKEIRVFRKEDFFLKKMIAASSSFGKYNTKHILYSSVPKIIIENTLVITMLIVIFILNFQNTEKDIVFSTLAVFGLAAFRLGPLTHNILASYAQVWNSKYSSQTLVDQLKDFENIENNKNKLKNINSVNLKNKIIFENCSFGYQEGNNIFENLNFEFCIGDKIGVIGNSGAGKTTFIYLLMGLLKFNTGRIFIDGSEIKVEEYNLLNEVAYIPQDTLLIDDTIKNNILFDTTYDEKKFQKCLIDASLKETVNSFPLKENTIVGHFGALLSGGQKQRISIARALYNQKKFLLFDEPTSSLDNESKNDIIFSLKKIKSDQTIFVISHDHEIIQDFDNVYSLQNKVLIKK